MDTNEKIIKWFVRGDTGVSSEAIVSQMTGNDASRSGFGDHPHDGDDFGRCYKLLEAVPEFKERINEMAKRSSEWSALVNCWDELTKLCITDSDDFYKRMREILDSVKDKKGVDLGNGITIYS